jgi:hypothetical protein
MSDSSGSPDLLVAPLPLTPKHRDELEQAISERVGAVLNLVLPGLIESAPNALCDTIVMHIMHESSDFFKRRNLKDVLRDRINVIDELRQHPQLRDIIRKACETRSNFTHIADLSECLCTPYLCPCLC